MSTVCNDIQAGRGDQLERFLVRRFSELPYKLVLSTCRSLAIGPKAVYLSIDEEPGLN
jgi:hypothetical protein